MNALPPRKRLLHLALAEGRGHLVRAHRLRHVLGQGGIDVEIATTTQAGRRFLATMGSPSWVLPGGFELAFDERQRIDKPTLHERLARYLVRGYALDVRALLQRHVDGYINDSFHPALLFSRELAPRAVLLHGDSLEEAVLEHWNGTIFERAYKRFANRVLARPRLVIHHSAAVSHRSLRNGRIVLPPLLAPLIESDSQVRSRIGAPARAPIAVVYLNPYFRDPAVGYAIGRALSSRFHIHAIAEGLSHIPGWMAADAQLPEVINRASLFVSSPGMAAIAEARRCKVPFVAIEGNQPEQAKNLARMEREWPNGSFARVSVENGEAELERAVLQAVSRVRCQRHENNAVGRLGAGAEWLEVFHGAFDVLSARIGGEENGNQAQCGVGLGDKQPEGWNEGWRRGRAYAAPRSPKETDIFVERPGGLGDHT